MTREEWVQKPNELLAALEWSEIHLFFWRFDLVAALEILDTGPERRKHLVKLMAERITLTAVYDHLYLRPEDLTEFGNPFAISDLTFVSSTKLQEVYENAPHLPNPIEVCIDGVDIVKFSPRNNKGCSPLSPITVGWVGNSLWGNNVGTDIKGFHTVFKPGVTKAVKSGASVVTRLADRATAPIPKQKMPDFYRDLDVYVCSSAIEGTPNPLLEAMSAGVIVLTTDVGVAHDVLGPKQKQLIVKRSPDAIAAALYDLSKNPHRREELRSENLSRRKELCWENRYIAWERLFAQGEVLVTDLSRRSAKEAALQGLLDRDRSTLARLRHFVFSRPMVYRFYLKMLDTHPSILKCIRNLFRHAARGAWFRRSEA